MIQFGDLAGTGGNVMQRSIPQRAPAAERPQTL
jgi:hypothetical protein